MRRTRYNHCSIIAQEAEKSNVKDLFLVNGSSRGRGSSIIYRRCQLFIVHEA